MPNKTKQVGVRLTDEEAEFLATFKVADAATPSDKLRAIIDEARRRHLGTEEYAGSLAIAEDLLEPTIRIIKNSENSHHMHSELVTRLKEWVPECMAYLIASNGNETLLEKEELLDIEKAVAQRVFTLMQSVLQLAVTHSKPLYDNAALGAGIGPVLELSRVVEAVNS